MAEEQTAGYVLMYRNIKNQLHNLTAKLTWVQNAGQAAQFKIPAAVTDWWWTVSTNAVGKGDLVRNRRSDRMMIVNVSELAQGRALKTGIPVMTNKELLKVLGASPSPSQLTTTGFAKL